MRQRLYQAITAAYARPLWVVVLGAALTVGVLAAVGGGAWTLYRSQRAAQETASRMQFLLSRVAVLDEVTTRSARMAAVSGDPVWQEQHQEVAPVLIAAMEELVEAAGALEQGPAAIRLRSAEQRIARLEREVFDHVARGDSEGALRLISTEEYNAHKRILTQAIGDLSSAVQDHVRAYDRSIQRRALVGGLLVTAGLGALLLIWWFTLAVLRRSLTERKQAEAELAAERDFVRAVIDSSPNGVLVNDADGRFVLANEVLAQFYGSTPQALAGKSVEELGLEVEHAERFQRADQRVIETGKEVTIPAIPISLPKAAEVRWIETRKVPLRTSHGRLQVLSILRDVTEQKEVEDALRASEAKLQALIEASPLPIQVLDTDGNVTLWNPAAERIFGWNRDEVLGRPNPIAPHEKQEEFRALKDRVLRGEPFTGVEVERQRKNGTPIDLRLSTALLYDAQGVVTGAMAVMEDVTKEKGAQAELRERERQLLLEKLAREHAEAAQERIHEILESITDAFFTVDEHWIFTYINSQVEAITGKPRQELLGENLWELFPTSPESRFWTEFHRAVDEQVAVEFEEYDPNLGIWAQVRAYPHPEGLTAYVRDITERKHAEEALQISEARFRNVIENMGEAVIITDLEERVLYANPRVEEMFGYSPDELCGKIASEVLIPAEERPKQNERQRDRAEGISERYAVWHRRRDGSHIWVEIQGVPFRNTDGEITGTLGVVRDITERKEAEEALQMSEARFRLMVESVRDYAIILLDPDGRVAHWNPGAERVKGYAAEEILGRHISCFYTEEERALGKPRSMLQNAAEQGASEDEGWRVRKDGARFWAGVVISAMHDEAGELVGFAKITRDLTERHRAEEKLHESQLTMETILAASPDIIEMLDLEGRLIWVSPAMESVLGYAMDEVKGRPMQDLIAPEDSEAFELSVRRLMEGDTDEVRLRYGARHRDGHWVRMEGHGRAIRSKVMRGLVLVARDVNEQEQLLESVHEAKEAAEAASRAKSEMLSRTSHELRTPMNAIIGFAQILEMDVQKAENRESVEQILRAGRHLLSLIEEVLDLARAESGEMTLPAEAVHVGELADEALSLLRPLARKNEVELPWNSPPTCNVHVLADPKRLKQVLLNLLSNAIKYNRAGGRVEVICGDLEQGRLRIKVRDSGPGIPPERLSSLFTPFERAGAERTQVEGTGLGLALSKALVHTMGGEIGAESTPGEGSTFWIELPRMAGYVGRQPETAAKTSAPVVLCVEDNADNLRLIERIFTRSLPGVELITATEGQPALELARQRRPDLILLDLNLPDISGEEVLRGLQEEVGTQQIPVVMISGDASPHQIRKLRERGVADYLTKPFPIPQFLQIVQDALTRGETKRGPR